LPRSEGKETVIADLDGKRPERVEGGIVQIDVARLAVLGLGQRNEAVGPINATMSEAQDFISTHPGVERHQDEGAEIAAHQLRAGIVKQACAEQAFDFFGA
jgi:hypothetical protein